MRIRKRYMLLAFASVAALAVGGIASANHISNTSTLSGTKICLSGNSCTSVALPFNTYKAVTLFVHTGTVYAHPNDLDQGGRVSKVSLLFDDDGKLNLTGIPQCKNHGFGAGTTIAQAWERCGPGADTAPEVNAYLSPPTAVSGRASTAPPSNFQGCTLTFNGPTNAQGNPTVVLFSRISFASTANCGSPATNNAGNITVILTGTITNAGIADFGKKLSVPLPQSLPVALDDYTSTTRRASVFTARCHDTNKTLNIRGIFEYTGSGQPTDVVNKTQPCTIG
jgi:hypothetical protein